MEISKFLTLFIVYQGVATLQYYTMFTSFADMNDSALGNSSGDWGSASGNSSDDWGNASDCSVTCGIGTRVITKQCIGKCDYDTAIVYEKCNMGCCPGKSSVCFIRIIQALLHKVIALCKFTY